MGWTAYKITHVTNAMKKEEEEKYQQEPAHCGIVLVSRLADFPDKGSLVET